MQVTRNFHSERDHMRCPCCNAFEWSEPFMRRVQIVRDIVGLPFYLDPSGGGFYRCRFYNDSIGGATSSRHLYGSAMDVSKNGWSGAVKWIFEFEAMKIGLSIGRFDTYYHIDLRPGRPVSFP